MKNLRSFIRALGAVCSALLFLVAAAPDARAQATASPPGKVAYQGFLTDLNGVPLGNSAPTNVSVIFRIWTASSGGSNKWSEAQAVTIDKGHFSVLLGEGSQNASEPFTSNLTTTFGGADASDRYLELTVGGLTITPRIQFLPGAYALLAANARQVVDANGNAVISSTALNISGSGSISGTATVGALNVSGSATVGTNLSVGGTASASAFSGNGASLTSLNANNLSSGTVPSARLNGATITGLSADNISSGILPIARGGTGSSLQNFVGLTGDQLYITGQKTFYNFVAVNGNYNTAPRAPLDVIGNAIVSGSIGIGTTSPTKGSLQIDSGNGSQPGYNPAGWLQAFGAGASSWTEGGNVSIWAAGQVFGSAFIAFSDERIKNIKGQSDSAADLKTLLDIQVTDYTYKDIIAKGNRPHKKVIAQQVEQVYPQAVTQNTDVVPDIYQKATVKDGWVKLATSLKLGDRVELIGEKEKGIYAVLEVRDGAFRTDFKPATEQIFVYGREVKDFRNVDYEAIAMLNVSATQELARQVAAKDAELIALRARLAVLEARDEARETRLIRLEKGLDGRGAIQQVKGSTRELSQLEK